MAKKKASNTRVIKNKSGSTSIKTRNNCTGKWSSKIISGRKKK